METKIKVKFMPMDVVHEIEFNETVLHLAQRQDIHIQSVCKGLPSCAECRIQIQEGEHHVPPPSSKELSLIGTAHYIDRSRLACQLRCFGDVTIDLTEQIAKESRAVKQPQGRASRKDGETSHAVKGNIIEDVKDEEFDNIKIAPSNNKRPGQDNFYDQLNKSVHRNEGRGGQRDSRRNQGGGQHRQAQGQGNDQSQSGGPSGDGSRGGNQGGGNGGNRHRHQRNENRNRNGKGQNASNNNNNQGRPSAPKNH